MPLYTYKCYSCRAIFDVRHGMFFENQRCIKCHSDDVFRMPSQITTSKTDDHKKAASKPGKIVDDYIKETKKAIKEEKKKMSSEEI